VGAVLAAFLQLILCFLFHSESKITNKKVVRRAAQVDM